MAITALVFGGLCFGAGICAGVFLADNDYLHTSDLKMVGGEVLEQAKIISSVLCPEPNHEEPRNPRVVRNHGGKMVIKY